MIDSKGRWCLSTVREYLDLRDDGLYWIKQRGSVKVGDRFGYLCRRENNRISYINKLYMQEKQLVFFHYHGVFSDYRLINYDDDPENNGILNILEDGEYLIRTRSPGVRYNPALGKFFIRKYGRGLQPVMAGPFDTESDAAAKYLLTRGGESGHE